MINDAFSIIFCFDGKILRLFLLLYINTGIAQIKDKMETQIVSTMFMYNRANKRIMHITSIKTLSKFYIFNDFRGLLPIDAYFPLKKIKSPLIIYLGFLDRADISQI